MRQKLFICLYILVFSLFISLCARVYTRSTFVAAGPSSPGHLISVYKTVIIINFRPPCAQHKKNNRKRKRKKASHIKERCRTQHTHKHKVSSLSVSRTTVKRNQLFIYIYIRIDGWLHHGLSTRHTPWSTFRKVPRIFRLPIRPQHLAHQTQKYVNNTRPAVTNVMTAI